MTAYLHYRYMEFKTKKLLLAHKGKEVTTIIPGLAGNEYVENYTGAIVGPGPYTRKWYAQVEVVDGILVKVK